MCLNVCIKRQRGTGNSTEGKAKGAPLTLPVPNDRKCSTPQGAWLVAKEAPRVTRPPRNHAVKLASLPPSINGTPASLTTGKSATKSTSSAKQRRPPLMTPGKGRSYAISVIPSTRRCSKGRVRSAKNVRRRFFVRDPDQMHRLAAQ